MGLLLHDTTVTGNPKFEAKLIRRINAAKWFTAATCKDKVKNDMDSSIRTWNVAQMLRDMKAFSEAEERKQKTSELFQAVTRKKHLHSLERRCS